MAAYVSPFYRALKASLKLLLVSNLLIEEQYYFMSFLEKEKMFPTKLLYINMMIFVVVNLQTNKVFTSFVCFFLVAEISEARFRCQDKDSLRLGNLIDVETKT